MISCKFTKYSYAGKIPKANAKYSPHICSSIIRQAFCFQIDYTRSCLAGIASEQRRVPIEIKTSMQRSVPNYHLFAQQIANGV